MSELTEVTGVGWAMAVKLERIGMRSVVDLSQACPDALQKVRGMGPARARAIITAAQAYVARETGTPMPLPLAPTNSSVLDAPKTSKVKTSKASGGTKKKSGKSKKKKSKKLKKA